MKKKKKANVKLLFIQARNPQTTDINVSNNNEKEKTKTKGNEGR